MLKQASCLVVMIKVLSNMSLTKPLSVLLSLTVCIFACFSCEPEESTIPVEKVTVSPTTISLTEGETSKLTATVFPEDADNKSISWSSNNKDVATVSNGTVTAVKAGSTTITVTTEDGKKTAKCDVTVLAKVYLVTGITLNKKDLTLQVGGSERLTVTISPTNATDKTVKWSSYDTSIATVSVDGQVKAIKLGTTTITAKAGEKEATCSVTVVATPVTSVTLNKTSESLKVGETLTLSATVNPDDATDKTVIWSTSNASVASVENGVVTAKTIGTATITATAGDKSAACAISVVATPVSSVTLNKASATLKVGETVTLTATVKPDDATEKTIYWSTSDASVAMVSGGVVTAMKVGTATITANAGNKSATCSITVLATPVASVTLDKTSASLKVGETVALTATVRPNDATEKTIYWSTSDASVATVSGGVITAMKVGTVTITAKAGDKTASCAITVEPTPVTSVTLDKTSVSLKVGQTVTLNATVYPSNATDKTVTWSTSNSSVATVRNGLVTALKIGTATITATAGDKIATCTIIVVATPVTSVTLDKTSASLKVGETVTLTATVKPDDATDKTVSWSTSDATVAEVSDGVVTTKKIGSATITATVGNKSATCSITVIATPITTVTLDKTSASLKVGEMVILTATVKPDDATDKTVSWSTNNASVATVSNGVVTAKAMGNATITAKAGNKTATCVITVTETPVTNVSLNVTSAELMVNQTLSLSATISPDNATFKTVTWSTSDNSVAIVTEGFVTAKALGTAVITAAVGGRTATCSITVIPTPVTSVSLNKSSISLLVGEQEQLSATITPNDATDKTMIWSSLDEKVASVDKTGKVIAIGKGETVVTVQSSSVGAKAECKVIVTDVQSGGIEDTTDDEINL